MRRIVLLAALSALPWQASAHKDRILSVNANGVIPVLPAEYEATRLHIELSKDDEKPCRDFASSRQGARLFFHPV